MQEPERRELTPEEEEALVQDALLEEAERRRQEGCCFECGAPDARDVSFMRVMSFLVITNHSKWDSFLCRDCTAKHGIREQVISSLLGWWGIPWGLMTFGALFINTRSLLKSTLAGKAAAVMVPVGLFVGAGWLFNSIGGPDRPADEYERVEERAADEYQRAMRFRDEGRHDEAFRALQSAHAADRDSWIVRLALADALMQRGELRPALPHLDHVLKEQPGNVDALGMRASALENLGEYREAVAAWRSLARVDDSEGIHLLIHRAADRAQLGRELIDEYRNRSRRDPTPFNRYLHGRLIDDVAERIEILGGVVEDDPDLVAARCDLVLALATMRRTEEAKQHLAELPPFSCDLDGWLLAAAVAMSDRDVEAAGQAVAQALEAHPGQPYFLIQRLYANTSAERYEAAAADIEELTRVMGGRPMWLECERVQLLVERGELARAKEELATLGERGDLEPFDSLVLQGALGRIAWAEGRLDHAARHFDVEPHPDVIPVRRNDLALKQALCLVEADRDVEARAVFTALEEAALPDQFDAAIQGARLFLGKLSPEEYLLSVRRQGTTYDNNAWYVVGVHHLQADDMEAARAAFEQSVATTVGRDFPLRLARKQLGE